MPALPRCPVSALKLGTTLWREVCMWLSMLGGHAWMMGRWREIPILVLTLP